VNIGIRDNVHLSIHMSACFIFEITEWISVKFSTIDHTESGQAN